MNASGPRGWRARTPVFWLGTAGILLFLYLVRGILPPFLIGAALAYLISPVVDNLSRRWHLPRLVAALGLYLVFLLVVALIVALAGPRLVEESRQLYFRAPQIVADLLRELFGPGPYDLFGPTGRHRSPGAVSSLDRRESPDGRSTPQRCGPRSRPRSRRRQCHRSRTAQSQAPGDRARSLPAPGDWKRSELLSSSHPFAAANYR